MRIPSKDPGRQAGQPKKRSPGRPRGSKKKPPKLKIPDDVGFRTSRQSAHVFGPDDLDNGVFEMAGEYSKYVKRLLKNKEAEDAQKIKAIEVYAKLIHACRGTTGSGAGGGRPKNPPKEKEDDGHGDKEYLESMLE